MPPRKSSQTTEKKKRFESNGEFSLQFARYNIQKAKEALETGVAASEGDYSWETFCAACESLVRSVADAHPGGPDDHNRLARNNFQSQAKRFTKWLVGGRGYPKKFLKDSGLLDSGLGGSEGDINEGSDSDGDEDPSDNEEVPIADQRRQPPPPPPPPPPPAAAAPPVPAVVDPQVVEIEESSEYSLDGDDEMQIITIVKKNVEIKAFAPVRFQDLLVVQAVMPGCAVLSSVRIVIDRNNPNEGNITADQDPYLSVGSRRTNKKWKEGNPKLCGELEGLIDLEVKKSNVTGSTPGHQRVGGAFKFPEGLVAQLNPIDPFVLGFRDVPTELGTTLFETKMVKTKTKSGKVVPGHMVTAFFFVEKFSHIENEAGRGLRIETQASDTESESSTPKNAQPAKKKRKTPTRTGGADETKSMDVESAMT